MRSSGTFWQATAQGGRRRCRNSDLIHLEETDTSFAMEWKGRYRIEDPAFIYADRNTGRVTTIRGYPTQKLAQA